MFSNRSHASEIIDLGPKHYTQAEYFDCLAKLGTIGRWLGGDTAGLSALKKCHPQSILDVGCGGGTYTYLLAKRFPAAIVVGLELNPWALEFAQQQVVKSIDPPSNLQFKLMNQPHLDEKPKSFDVVTSTLVCHHLNDVTLIDFIKRSCVVARHKVIINDLHRHPLAYYSFKMLSKLCLRNRLIQHDGPLSVKRAFKRQDWDPLLEAAGVDLNYVSITWHWAFRWVVEIDCTKKNVC